MRRWELAKKLRQNGKSYREIGEKLGVSHESVRQALAHEAVNSLTPETITGRDGNLDLDDAGQLPQEVRHSNSDVVDPGPGLRVIVGSGPGGLLFMLVHQSPQQRDAVLGLGRRLLERLALDEWVHAQGKQAEGRGDSDRILPPPHRTTIRMDRTRWSAASSSAEAAFRPIPGSTGANLCRRLDRL